MYSLPRTIRLSTVRFQKTQLESQFPLEVDWRSESPFVSSPQHTPNIKNSLKRKYQAFNVKIGSEASILKYENIQPGSNAHRTIGAR